MTTSQKINKSESFISAMDAITHRRAVRDYKPQQIDQAVIRILLDAAVHAPTAVHEEPWAFAIVQDANTLKRLSDNVKDPAALTAFILSSWVAMRLIASQTRSSMSSITPERSSLSTGNRWAHSLSPTVGWRRRI